MEKSLKDLLSRLPVPGLKESADRHLAAEVLSKTLTLPIKPHQITLKDGIITVSVPPVVKSAIQIHQSKLKEQLEQEGINISSFR